NDKNDAQRLRNKARHHRDECIGTLSVAQPPINACELPHVNRLRVVQQDVADASEAFLDSLKTLASCPGHNLRVLAQAAPGGQRQAAVDRPEAEDCNPGGKGAEHHQTADDEDPDDDSNAALEHRQQHASRESWNVLQAADDTTAVYAYMEHVGLMQHAVVQHHADIVANA